MLQCFGLRKKFFNTTRSSEDWDVKAGQKLVEESNHFLNIFPDVVWGVIARKVKNQHVQNLINSSPFFRHLLFHKRVLYLAKNVLKVLVPIEVGDVCLNGPLWNYKNETDVKVMILNCRLICQAWKNAIGQLAQITNPDLERFPKPDFSKQFVVSHLLRKSYEFSSISRTEKFLEIFGNPRINPFIGNTIRIIITPIQLSDNDFDLHHSLIITLLQNFGHHIFYCQIYSSSNTTSYQAEQLYIKLVEWLWNAPNLRHLAIKFPNSNELHQPRHINLPPMLNNLQSLTLEHVSGSFANALIGNNLHLSKLIINCSLQSMGRIDRHYNFENLERVELSVNARELKDIIVPSWNFKNFNLKVVPYSLVGFSHYSHCVGGDISCNQILDFLHAKFDSIVDELEMYLSCEPSVEKVNELTHDSLASRLNLSKIRKLNLTVENICASDFLLGVKDTLEVLKITWKVIYVNNWGIGYLKEVKQKQQLQVLGYEEKMYESNIWEFFPKLKAVTLNCPGSIQFKYYRRFLSITKKSKQSSVKLFSCIQF